MTTAVALAAAARPVDGGAMTTTFDEKTELGTLSTPDKPTFRHIAQVVARTTNSQAAGTIPR